MKTNNILITILIVSCIAFNCFSQQTPHYTQYMYNTRSINPAYMINKPGIIEVGGIYRNQWSGIKGAPNTGNLFASIPLKSKFELGLNFYYDKIGSNIQQTTNAVNIDVAYKVKLTKKTDLSFGLKSGIRTIELNAFNSNLNTDKTITESPQKTVFSLGSGLFLFNNNYYLGLSTPNFIKNKITDATLKTSYESTSHFYLIGGYILTISNKVKIKPAFIVKHVNGAPLSFDFSANVLLFDKFELGIANRNQDAFSALASFYITPELKMGYAYDFGVNDLNEFNTGSHELMLIYNFDILGLSKKYISPRFY